MIENLVLPEGWTSENFAGHTVNYTVIAATDCRVTVDWSARCFRSGITTTAYPTLGGTYSGRGWKERLIADAVKWLQDVVNS